MNAKEFVEQFYIEKNNTLKSYFSDSIDTEVGEEINKLGLTTEQMEKMKYMMKMVVKFLIVEK